MNVRISSRRDSETTPCLGSEWRSETQEKIWYEYNSFYDKLDEDGLYYETDTGLIHSFNTQKTVYDKTAWGIKQGLGGVMVWHYACDVPAEAVRDTDIYIALPLWSEKLSNSVSCV